MSLTLTQAINRVRTELDLLDEPQVTDSEITTYLNEGIDVVESIILDIYEDYFLARGTPINLVSGTSEYNYPADIWGNKLRALIYRNGAIVTEIPRQYNQINDFEATERMDQLGVWTPYTMVYRPLNTTFKLTPAPTSSESSVLVPWYIRQATRLVNGSDTIDIPEGDNCIVAYAKNEIAMNKSGIGDANKTMIKLKSLLEQLNKSLSNRVPDQWNFVAKDMSYYEEHT